MEMINHSDLGPLREMLEEIAQCGSSEQILERVNRFVRRERPHTVCTCLWFGEGETPQDLAFFRHLGNAPISPSKWPHATGCFDAVPLDEPLIGAVFRDNAPAWAQVSRGWTPPDWAAQQGIVAYAARPIHHGGRPIGVIANYLRLEVAPASIDEALFLLGVVGNTVGAALKHEQAMATIEAIRQQLQRENAYLREEVSSARGFGEILGSSVAITELQENVRLVADTEAPVLITGETGSGKELVARAIHQSSTRSARPLVVVNCAAVAKELFESEFFGHARGAFSGAHHDRAGRFAVADGGTLFLDEVAEIPLDLQSKLLRVLQTGTYERVGDDRTRTADVRIIAACNRDLQQAVASGGFRKDLYYRLNVFPVQVPPLRDRHQDIPLLAQSFLQDAAQRCNIPTPQFDATQLALLCSYDWPGNVRELKNLMERVAIISRGKAPDLRAMLGLEDPVELAQHALPPKTEMQSAETAGPEELIREDQWREMDRQRLSKALERCDWRVQGSGGAAELLGISPSTLRSRINALGIQRPE